MQIYYFEICFFRLMTHHECFFRHTHTYLTHSFDGRFTDRIYHHEFNHPTTGGHSGGLASVSTDSLMFCSLYLCASKSRTTEWRSMCILNSNSFGEVIFPKVKSFTLFPAITMTAVLGHPCLHWRWLFCENSCQLLKAQCFTDWAPQCWKGSLKMPEGLCKGQMAQVRQDAGHSSQQ